MWCSIAAICGDFRLPKKYPAKNICPDCPAKKRKWVCPISPLVSFFNGLAWPSKQAQKYHSDGSVGLSYIRNTKVWKWDGRQVLSYSYSRNSQKSLSLPGSSPFGARNTEMGVKRDIPTLPMRYQIVESASHEFITALQTLLSTYLPEYQYIILLTGSNNQLQNN